MSDAVQAPVIEPGNQGLKGLLAQVGNATAMTLVAVLLLLSTWYIQRMHSEAMGNVLQLHTQERDFNREMYNSLTRVIERNSAAIDTLASEIRRLRP
jgi:hypothetical protein